ncbi:Dyp-type peroxidase [Nocardioides sp. URHA0032]|uniref:Dyp-type peroxidase n=1 Tax=Nocardioides sp. URHA0032 TaxID=1380388 RepID=UPI000490DA16|nr:Dyp-type peroxidase [Nocardioides sp. URHA0032]
MPVPQPGIFALGTLAHSYVELDLADGASGADLVREVADLAEPRTTMGGVNLVTGFRPEVWFGPMPAGTRGFTEPVAGPDGFTMPATQHDAALWVAGGSYDVVFDAVIGMLAALEGVAVLAHEVVGWTYHRDRDLTGFIDGTENHSVLVSPHEVLVPDGARGAGGSVLLLQQWTHEARAWTGLPTERQERVMGRTKPDSIELEDKPEGSHVARTDQDEFGRIFRRNTPYGTVSDHGTMFVGFAADQGPLARMLDSMAGVGGVRDDLTRYSTPLTGGYYFVPSVEDLSASGRTR